MSLATTTPREPLPLEEGSLGRILDDLAKAAHA
jgi:hypothetical protein